MLVKTGRRPTKISGAEKKISSLEGFRGESEQAEDRRVEAECAEQEDKPEAVNRAHGPALSDTVRRAPRGREEEQLTWRIKRLRSDEDMNISIQDAQ